MDVYSSMYIAFKVVLAIMAILAAMLSLRLLTVMTYQRMSETQLLATKSNTERIRFTRDAIELISSIISRIAVIKVTEFEESHNMDKVTIANIKEIARDVSRTAISALKEDGIVFTPRMIVSTEFITDYIVKLSFEHVRRMVNTINRE